MGPTIEATTNMIVAISTLVLAMSTLALVVATAYYAWQTRQTVKIMQDQQVASIRPLLVLACRSGDWRVVNIGSGPAVNGRYETSYRKTEHHYAVVGDREAASSGPLEPLGAGDVHDA